MATGNLPTTTQQGVRTIRTAATNPALEFAERVGYAARGLLYMVMGLLALGVALGIGGTNTDQPGSLAFITANPFGKVILVVVVIALLAYSIWGFVRAFFDPLHRGHDAMGVADRVGFISSAVSYAAIAVLGLQMLAGVGSASGDGTQKLVTTILTLPAGQWLTLGIGVASVGVGLGQFFASYKATFKKDMKQSEMSHAERKVTDFLGRFGMFSRGVTFSLVGVFLVQAGLHRDAGLAHGFGGAFAVILAQSYGHPLLGLVALGFVALGLHSFAMARYARLMGSVT
ncbi:MAG: DUF1206 domain-containing protein [Candidatus Dormibacteraeota bacterium]|nr:DUF1206 domain-containing protein [Candidatus Dormibacteraeota bacterium]